MSTVEELPAKKLNIAKAFSEPSRLIVDKWTAIRSYLDKSLDEESFLSSVIMELNNLDEGIDKGSICKSVANLAFMGLMPGAAMQLAYFCPRKDSKSAKTFLQVELMYQGLLALAYDNGFLRDVTCDVVLEGEECERENRESGPYLRHKLPNERDLKWDNVVGAYCVWHGIKGGFGVQWTGKDELSKIKNKARPGSVWGMDPIKMCEKTPLKRAAKFWPKNRDGKLNLASSMEDSLDSGKDQPSIYQQEQASAIDLEDLD